MNSMTKKITIYLIVGIMQVGLGIATIIEASPLTYRWPTSGCDLR